MSDQVDATISFAIPAWHMTDWVWVQHEHKLRDYFHVNSRRQFQNEMRSAMPWPSGLRRYCERSKARGHRSREEG
jgi:hypothetical protein